MLHADTLTPLTELPCHEDILTTDMLDELKLRSRRPSPSHSYFVAQHWEGARGTHPDNAMQTKHGWLKLLKRHLSLPPELAIWLWMDFVSVPTRDADKRIKGLRSTLYYCQVSEFLSGRIETYA